MSTNPTPEREALTALIAEWREAADGFGRYPQGRVAFARCASDLEALLASSSVVAGEAHGPHPDVIQQANAARALLVPLPAETGAGPDYGFDAPADDAQDEGR